MLFDVFFSPKIYLHFRRCDKCPEVTNVVRCTSRGNAAYGLSVAVISLDCATAHEVKSRLTRVAGHFPIPGHSVWDLSGWEWQAPVVSL